jgi:hypothetical protein
MKNPKDPENQTEESPKGKNLVMLQPILRKLPEESPREFSERAMEGLGAMFGEEVKINETPQTEPETHDPEAG